MINPFVGTIYENACLSKIDFDENQSEILNDFILKPKNIIYVHSPPGVGKSYFCAALTNLRFSQKKYCWYMEEKDFFTRCDICMTEKKCMNHEINKIAESEFLIYDDLGSTRGNEHDPSKWLFPWQKDALFKLLDLRVKYAMPTIISSNYSIQDLMPIFHERFTSRLAATKNKIIKLKGEDKRQQRL
jgi:DNA replication protein DnaC